MADHIGDTGYGHPGNFPFNTLWFLPAFLVVAGIADSKQPTSSGHLNGYEQKPARLQEFAFCDLQAFALDPATPYHQETRTGDDNAKQHYPGCQDGQLIYRGNLPAHSKRRLVILEVEEWSGLGITAI